MEPTLKRNIAAIFDAEAPSTEPMVKLPAPAEAEGSVAADEERG